MSVAAIRGQRSRSPTRMVPEPPPASHAADPVDRVFAGRWTTWGAAYGGSQTIGGDALAGSHDTDTTTFGLVGGTTYRFNDTVFGMALGGGSSDFSLPDELGSGHANTFNAGIYGRQGLGNLYLSGALAYGFNSVETSRTAVADMLAGDFDAHSFSGRAEAGYDIATPVATLTPYAAFQAIAYHLPDYSETGPTGAGIGSFALAYQGGTTTATRTELGLRLNRAMTLASGATLSFDGRAALAINSGDDIGFTAGFQALPGTAFTIEGATPDRTAALLDAGIQYRTTSGLTAAIAFQGQFSSNVQSYAGKASIAFQW